MGGLGWVLVLASWVGLGWVKKNGPMSTSEFTVLLHNNGDAWDIQCFVLVASRAVAKL